MIDLIIPIFNRPEYTQACLDSLTAVKHGTEIRPILVNNGSRRRTSEMLRTFCEQWKGTEAQLIELDRNCGFAGALNKGVKRTTSSTVGIMHNDVIVAPGWAGEMDARLAESDEEVKIICPRTNYANEFGVCLQDIRASFEKIKPPNKNFVNAEMISGMLKTLYPQGIAAIAAEIRNEQPAASYSCEISSFCMFVKRSVFNSYDLFDEDFWPRGYEDKFWFRSMERDGCICQIANRAYVHHFGNITSDGPGFSFPDIMRINEAKFKEKCLSSDSLSEARNGSIMDESQVSHTSKGESK